MNNQQLFQIVQSAGGMHLLYNNDLEQVRAIAQAAFEAGKSQIQDERDRLEQQLSQLERCTGMYYARGQQVPKNDMLNLHAALANHAEAIRQVGEPERRDDSDKQAAVVQDVLDMSDSRNWQVGDVVRSNGSIIAYTVAAIYDGGLLIEGCDMAWIHEEASRSFTWLRHATKEAAK